MTICVFHYFTIAKGTCTCTHKVENGSFLYDEINLDSDLHAVFWRHALFVFKKPSTLVHTLLTN